MSTTVMKIDFKLMNDTHLPMHSALNYSQAHGDHNTSTTLNDKLTQGALNISGNVSDSSDQAFCTTYTFVHYSVIVPILVILGLLGNTVSFCIFGKEKVKTSTIFLFQSLAVVDNILLVLVLPVYSIPAFYDYYLEAESDKIANVIDAFVFPFAILAQTVTVWLTVLVAFNRYVAVCKPYKAARLCTVRQAKCQLAVVVLCSIIFNLPKFFHPTLSLETKPDNTTHYVIGARAFMTDPLYINVYESALYFIVMLFLPLLVLNVLNVKLVRALKELNRRRVDMVQNARQKNDNNVTLVLIIVVVVFVICQVPALANRLMWSFLPNSSRMCKGLHFFVPIHSNIFAVTNSSINFVIYMAFNPRFRQTMLDSPCCLPFSSCFKHPRNNQEARGDRLLKEVTASRDSNFRTFSCCNRLMPNCTNNAQTRTTIANPCQHSTNKNNSCLNKSGNKTEERVDAAIVNEVSDSARLPIINSNNDKDFNTIHVAKEVTDKCVDDNGKDKCESV